MARGSGTSSQPRSLAVAVFAFAVAAILFLIDGDYAGAFSMACFAASMGLILAGAEARRGFLLALAWILLAAAVIPLLAKLLPWF